VSVPDLLAAIDEFLAAWNQNPRPLVWTATVDSIVENFDAVARRWKPSNRVAPCRAQESKNNTSRL